jgi:hypothetical protein
MESAAAREYVGQLERVAQQAQAGGNQRVRARSGSSIAWRRR